MKKNELFDLMIEWMPLILGVCFGGSHLILGYYSDIPFWVVLIGSIIMFVVVTVFMFIILNIKGGTITD